MTLENKTINQCIICGTEIDDVNRICDACKEASARKRQLTKKSIKITIPILIVVTIISSICVYYSQKNIAYTIINGMSDVENNSSEIFDACDKINAVGEYFFKDEILDSFVHEIKSNPYENKTKDAVNRDIVSLYHYNYWHIAFAIDSNMNTSDHENFQSSYSYVANVKYLYKYAMPSLTNIAHSHETMMTVFAPGYEKVLEHLYYTYSEPSSATYHLKNVLSSLKALLSNLNITYPAEFHLLEFNTNLVILTETVENMLNGKPADYEAADDAIEYLNNMLQELYEKDEDIKDREARIASLYNMF